MTAHFAGKPLGYVTEVDIGGYANPAEPDLQYYVYSHPVLQDVVRWTSEVDLSPLIGRLAPLRLRAATGAEYRVEAVLMEQTPEPTSPGDQARSRGARYRQRFEAEGPAEHRETAQSRHGIDDLATALLLDALSEPGDDGAEAAGAAASLGLPPSRGGR
jgi:hypothetical protein